MRLTAAAPACPECRWVLIMELDEKGTPWMACPLCHSVYAEDTGYIVILKVA